MVFRRLIALTVLATASHAQVFVDADATGAATGASWGDAHPSLQDAFDASPAGSTFWVAEGTYLPSTLTNPIDGRSATFLPPDDATILGGFDGTETSAAERDPVAHPTILSGDVGAPGVDVDNSYHVVRLEGLSSALLDGLVIRDGRADRPGVGEGRGGGVLGDGGAVTLRDCVVQDNLALGAGGGWFHLGGTVVADGCTFRANTVDEEENTLAGGGMTTFGSDTLVTGCLFEQNLSVNFSFGAGLSISQGTAHVRKSTFRDNEADRWAAIEISQSTETLLEDLLIEDNFARGTGSALSLGFLPSALVRDCVIRGNEVQSSGGAVSTQGSFVRFQRCRFEANVVPFSGSTLAVGAGAAGFVVEDCEFVGNTFGTDGGALAVGESAPLVVGTRFVGNVSGGNGAAVRLTTQSTPFGSQSSPRFVNCEFSGNQANRGAALYSGGQVDATFENCTIANNTASDVGGGVLIEQAFFDPAEVTIVNSVLWGNDDVTGSGQDAQLATTGTVTVSIDHTCVEGLDGSLGGTGNIDLDPLFVDGDGADDLLGTLDDDLRLGAGSPCVDAGDGDALPVDTIDIDCDGFVSEELPLDLGHVLRRTDDPTVADTGVGAGPALDLGAHERGAWTDLGNALAAEVPDPRAAPCLVGIGSLVGGTPVDHLLTNAAPNAVCVLFIGLTTINAPFKQGILVPAPDIAVALTTSATGTSSIPATWPAGLPSDLDVFLQYWVFDTDGPANRTASNAIRGTTP